MYFGGNWSVKCILQLIAVDLTKLFSSYLKHLKYLFVFLLTLLFVSHCRLQFMMRESMHVQVNNDLSSGHLILILIFFSLIRTLT